MNVAEKEYGVEQYLTPADILKLDEKSALVYISEYYYGINAQVLRSLSRYLLVLLMRVSGQEGTCCQTYQEVDQVHQRKRCYESQVPERYEIRSTPCEPDFCFTDGEKLLAHLATAESLLQDVETVDNTMAGAKKKLADFNTYKVVTSARHCL